MRRPRLPSVRGLLVLVGCLAVIAAGVLFGIGLHYSNVLLNVSRAGSPDDLVVRAATRSTVTLDRTPATLRPGTYGLAWHGDEAVVGAIQASTGATVTRALSGSVPPVGTKARLDTDVWSSDPQTAVGLAYDTVDVPDPLGPMPAWLVPGRSRTWVVAVHGRADGRDEALRILPTLHRLGLPVLDISYRNDEGAPRSPDGRYHLGDTEWRDVEAAVKYATTHGARHVVLYGWSMGGALVDAFEQRSTYANRVPAVVLDAPVLDWRATLDLQASNRGLPHLVTAVAEQIVQHRIGIDWADFDLEDHPARVRVPTLLFHGESDTTVPIEPARRLAAAQPKVTFVPVPHADHTQAWNVDPAAYDRAVTDFLAPYAAGRGRSSGTAGP